MDTKFRFKFGVWGGNLKPPSQDSQRRIRHGMSVWGGGASDVYAFVHEALQSIPAQLLLSDSASPQFSCNLHLLSQSPFPSSSSSSSSCPPPPPCLCPPLSPPVLLPSWPLPSPTPRSTLLMTKQTATASKTAWLSGGKMAASP